ncbi:hypothetical protein KQ313_14065 [Synechococcus sp. CS-1325]|nr:hypothetical protein [Synechococcus sp. CS-1325]
MIGEFCWKPTAQSLPLLPLHRRGADAEGTWMSHDGHCWLGHTPLPIQDLTEAGAQPISSHCGRITLVFNGEIYNHKAVRGGLRFQLWRGHTDSETLVEGLAQRGPALLLELRGMFSFAAYDRDKQQLLLGRDRLGIKPLYMQWLDAGLRFGSERRAIGVNHRLAAQEISQMLAFGHLLTPSDFCGPESGGCHSLPPGVVVRVNRDRPHLPIRYWPPQPRPDWTPLPIHDARWARRFLRQQLEVVVQQHLLADRPGAFLLSSGINAGILTALACRLMPGRISSLTVGLPGTHVDESDRALKLSRHCGSDHHLILVDEDQALGWMEAGLQSLDIPSAHGLKSNLICRAVAEQGTKVAVGGLGADELFGGYPSHRIVPWLFLMRSLPAGLRSGLLQAGSGRLATKIEGLPTWDRWHLAVALRRWASDGDLVAAGVEALKWSSPPPERISQGWGQISWAELFGTSVPRLLRDINGYSMATGLELRVPFFDHRLVEIALRMPQRFQRPGNGLLRASCQDLFPVGYLDSPRQAFSLPMRPWMLGPLLNLCSLRLEALQSSGWLDPDWITQQWQAFYGRKLPWPRAWSLVVLGEWALREQHS